MRRLTVLYDSSCGLCRRARKWLGEQVPFVALEFLPAASEEARERYPDIDPQSMLADFTLVADDRHVYRGAKAWIMCLWALRKYRGWALKIAASPARFALAKGFINRVSKNRYRVSELLERLS